MYLSLCNFLFVFLYYPIWSKYVLFFEDESSEEGGDEAIGHNCAHFRWNPLSCSYQPAFFPCSSSSFLFFILLLLAPPPLLSFLYFFASPVALYLYLGLAEWVSDSWLSIQSDGRGNTRTTGQITSLHKEVGGYMRSDNLQLSCVQPPTLS